MDVRRYGSGDRAAVLRLGERLRTGMASWRDPTAAAAAVQGWVASSVDRADADDQAVFVADDRGEVVGFVSVAEHTHFTGEVEGYVGELAVAETGVRAGTGRALMAAAETWARDRGLRRLSLETGAANAGARAFYAALGYAEEDVRLSRGLDTDSKSPPTELMLSRRGWLEAQSLRKSVLGWPMGPVAGDTDALTCHLFAVDGAGEGVGVVSFTPHPCPSRPGVRAMYLWGMAVRPDAQHTGHGTRLVEAVLQSARETGAAVVWADARLTAVPFYQRLGAVREGPSYVDEVTGLADERVIFDL